MLPPSQVDGVLPVATFDTATTAGRGTSLRTVPNAQVIGVDFEAAHVFGREPSATGVSGATPAPGHAAITTDLARALDVGPGSRIDVYAYGHPRTLIVDRVLPRRGLAGFSLRNEQESRNVLVSPTVFEAMVRARRRRCPAGPVRRRLQPWRRRVRRRPERRGEGVDPACNRRHRASGDDDQAGSSSTSPTRRARASPRCSPPWAASACSPGLLLLINLFVMLAAERKSELGMARAVGMRRSALVGAFATEGFIYALAATLLGTARRRRARPRARRVVAGGLQFRAQPVRPLLHRQGAEPRARRLRSRSSSRWLTIVVMSIRVQPAEHHPSDSRHCGAAAASPPLLAVPRCCRLQRSVLSGASRRLRPTSRSDCCSARRYCSSGSRLRSRASFPGER